MSETAPLGFLAVRFRVSVIAAFGFVSDFEIRISDLEPSDTALLRDFRAALLAGNPSDFSLGRAVLPGYSPRAMQPARHAVIDVGTNSVKLLVAEVTGHVVRPLREEGNQTRLGEGFYQTHRLQPRPMARTAQAVADYVTLARSDGVQSIRLVATSAARDAINQSELVQAVEKQSGLKLEIIPGEQEAAMAYLGVTTDPAFAGQRLLIAETGGGSTQFILGEGDHRTFQRSFKVGAVRLLELLNPGDPPTAVELQRCRGWVRDFISQQVHPTLDPVLAEGKERTQLVGTGGTAAILARMENSFDDYDRERIEGTRLGAEAVTKWVERLWGRPLAERKRIIGLPANRADVILMGAAVYEAVMRQFGFAELRVSTRGMRFAAVLQPVPEAAPLFQPEIKL